MTCKCRCECHENKKSLVDKLVDAWVSHSTFNGAFGEQAKASVEHFVSIIDDFPDSSRFQICEELKARFRKEAP